jgi:hypothetical protein
MTIQWVKRLWNVLEFAFNSQFAWLGIEQNVKHIKIVSKTYFKCLLLINCKMWCVVLNWNDSRWVWVTKNPVQAKVWIYKKSIPKQIQSWEININKAWHKLRPTWPKRDTFKNSKKYNYGWLKIEIVRNTSLTQLNTKFKFDLRSLYVWRY